MQELWRDQSHRSPRKAGSGEFQTALNYCKHLRLDLDAKFYAEEVAVYEAEMCYRLGHI